MFLQSARTTAGLVLLAGLTANPANAQTSVQPPVHVAGHRLVATASTPIDANLYTTYSVYAPHNSLSWSRCGATAQSEGCFGNGQISGFKRVCAMIDGTPVVAGSQVTHDLYILDGGATSSDTVTLSVYQFVDEITSSFDTTTVTLLQTVNLTLQGGAAAACSMAANADYVYVGTNASDYAVSVKKTSYATAQLPGFSPAIPVTQITADDRGYVIVQYGSGTNNGFYMYSPDGANVEDGGGNALIPSTVTGTLFP